MKRIRQLTDVQFEILDLMNWDWGYPFSHFECTREEAKKELHILRDAGLVQYWRGLMDGDGKCAGSGYALNCKARNIIEKLMRDWEEKHFPHLKKESNNART